MKHNENTKIIIAVVLAVVLGLFANFVLAMSTNELPFTTFHAVLVGGFIGYVIG